MNFGASCTRLGIAMIIATRFYKYPTGDGKLFIDTIPQKHLRPCGHFRR